MHFKRFTWPFTFKRLSSSVKGKYSSLIGIAADIGIGVSVGLLLTNYVVGFSSCSGPSMLPTIAEKGEVVVVDRFSFSVLRKPYKKGDVVLCNSPIDEGKSEFINLHNYADVPVLCKRIAYVEGDFFYWPYPFLNSIAPGYVWLAGDNIQNSNDSRHFGAVPLSLLRGRVIFKINFRKYPFVSAVSRDFSAKDPADDPEEEKK